MLTGDKKISSGEAFVHGISLKANMPEVHKIIGYCPQFDALLEDLTGTETLELFALLRGIHTKDIPTLSRRLATDLNFMKHIDKKVGEYSGGNKRKLSTAVALIGNPVVVYLGKASYSICQIHLISRLIAKIIGNFQMNQQLEWIQVQSETCGIWCRKCVSLGNQLF